MRPTHSRDSGDVIADVLEQVAAHEDSILYAAMDGQTLCPNCKGKGHEGAGTLDSDFPCRTCSGMGLA